jgi:hypothetical protein
MKYQLQEQVEQKYLPPDHVMYICSEQMKYQLPEQVEQKYLPPDQQRLTEHERYFQVSIIKNPLTYLLLGV